jgi:hypothetical protein
MLSNFIKDFRAKMKDSRSRRSDYRNWAARDYAAPSPSYIKRRVLLRNGIPNATWVETGTYMGETTAFLSEHSNLVFTIEPALQLYEAAKIRFSTKPHVTVIQGISETVFPELIPTLTGEVNFWLDGHFSSGPTHQGPKDTPIEEELACIEKHIKSFSKLVVLVDDVRCFNPSLPDFSTYPKIDILVDWAKKNNLNWHIEHDIFIARTA